MNGLGVIYEHSAEGPRALVVGWSRFDAEASAAKRTRLGHCCKLIVLVQCLDLCYTMKVQAVRQGKSSRGSYAH